MTTATGKRFPSSTSSPVRSIRRDRCRDRPRDRTSFILGEEVESFERGASRVDTSSGSPAARMRSISRSVRSACAMATRSSLPHVHRDDRGRDASGRLAPSGGRLRKPPLHDREDPRGSVTPATKMVAHVPICRIRRDGRRHRRRADMGCRCSWIRRRRTARASAAGGWANWSITPCRSSRVRISVLTATPARSPRTMPKSHAASACGAMRTRGQVRSRIR